MAARPVRIVLKALAGVAAAFALLTLAAWIVLNTEAFRSWLLAKAQTELKAATGLELSIGELGGSLLFGLELKDVAVTAGGERYISIKRLSASYQLLAALGGRLRIRRLELDRPWVRLPLPVKESGAGGGAPPLAVTLRNLSITGGGLVGGGLLGPVRQVEDLDLRGELSLDLRGLRGQVVLGGAKVHLDGLDRPVRVAGPASWAGTTLTVREFTVSEGPNAVSVAGGLEVGDLRIIKARLSGRGLIPGALPFAWPLATLPAGGVDLKLAADGLLEDLGFDLAIHRGTGALTLKGRLDVFGGRLSLTGELDRLDLAAWGLLPGPALASGSLEVSEDRWGWQPDAAARVRLDLGTWQGPGLPGRSAGLMARLNNGDLDVEVLRAAGPWGSLEGRGNLRLPVGDRPAALTARVEFQDLSPPALAAGHLPPQLTGISLAGSLDADGPLDGLAVKLELGPSRVMEGQAIESLSASGRLMGRAWRLDRLKLASSWLTLDASGEIGPADGQCYFSLSTPEMADVLGLAASMGLLQPVKLAGRVTVTGRVSGPWRAAQVQVQANVDDLVTKNAVAQRLTVEADLTDLGPHPKGRVLVGAVDWKTGELVLDRGTARLELASPAWRLALNAAGPDLNGSLVLDGSGPLGLPLNARLSGLRLQPRGLETWTQHGDLALNVGAERIEAGRLVMTSGRQRVELEGFLKPDGSVQARLEAREVVLGPLWKGFSGLPEEARLKFTADLDGSLEAPRAKMEGRVDGLNWEKLPPLMVSFAGSYDQERLVLSGSAHSGGRQVLDLAAEAGLQISLRPPIWEPTPTGLKARVVGQKLPLELFQPLLAGLTGIKGTLDLDLTAGGELERPVLSGRAAVNNGAFVVEATGQPVEAIEVVVNVAGRRLTVQKATMVSRGSLSLSGGVVLPLGGPGSVDLRLASDGFLVALGTWGQVLVDMEVTATGPSEAPTVAGVVRPRRALVTLGLAAPSGLKDVVFLKPGEAPPPIQRGHKAFNPTGYLGEVAIDVRADLNQGFRVEMDDGWLNLTGEVTARKPRRQAMTYHGGITLSRGAFIVQGKRFQIESGSLDFAGRRVPNPTLNVQALLATGQYLIYITVAGTAMSPQLQLSSQPSMSQADILSTIIFGRPANSLSSGEGQELSGTALAFLGEAGRAEMAKIFGPDLTPDVVTVHNAGASQQSSLEAGKYISEDLYLRYRQVINGDGQDVGVDYRLNRYFSIETQVGTSRNTGADLIFNYDFD